MYHFRAFLWEKNNLTWRVTFFLVCVLAGGYRTFWIYVSLAICAAVVYECAIPLRCIFAAILSIQEGVGELIWTLWKEKCGKTPPLFWIVKLARIIASFTINGELLNWNFIWLHRHLRTPSKSSSTGWTVVNTIKYLFLLFSKFNREVCNRAEQKTIITLRFSPIVLAKQL